MRLGWIVLSLARPLAWLARMDRGWMSRSRASASCRSCVVAASASTSNASIVYIRALRPAIERNTALGTTTTLLGAYIRTAIIRPPVVARDRKIFSETHTTTTAPNMSQEGGMFSVRRPREVRNIHTVRLRSHNADNMPRHSARSVTMYLRFQCPHPP